MEDKDKADLYFKLAQAADDRFKSRRDVEWKVTIGLWTLFGAAAGAAITARVWTPNGFQVAGLSLLVIVILGIYRVRWLPYLAKAFSRDQRISYYWESGIQELVGRSVPPFLDPGTRRRGARAADWIRMDDPAARADHLEFELSAKLHESQKTQFWITTLFALLFVVVLIGKAFDVNSQLKTKDDTVPPMQVNVRLGL